METRLPLTAEEIVHQTLIDQLDIITCSNNDSDRFRKHELTVSIQNHIARQVHSMLPYIFDHETCDRMSNRIAGHLTAVSTSTKKFVSKQDIKESIKDQLKLEMDTHHERIFRNLGTKIDKRYRDIAIDKLKNVRIHPDQAENLIKFLLNEGEAIAFMDSELAKYPFFTKLSQVKEHPINSQFKATVESHHTYLVQYNKQPNIIDYLEYFEDLIQNFIDEKETFGLPSSMTRCLLSKCMTDLKENGKHGERYLIYCFIEDGGKEEIMELAVGLRKTKTYSELPKEFDDLQVYFFNNPDTFRMFMSVLTKAIITNKGFKPTISYEYGETISF